METTLTTCKNNSFSRRATARRFHNRAQLCAEEQEVVSTVVHVVFKNLSSFTFPREARAAGYTIYMFCTANTIFLNSSKRYFESCGPGQDSGWYCTENAGSVLCLTPSIELSLRFMCVTSRQSGTDSGKTAKLWFWLVISTCPVARFFTGWLQPWCPNLSRPVFAPQASDSS